jgi:hypothetical protein
VGDERHRFVVVEQSLPDGSLAERRRLRARRRRPRRRWLRRSAAARAGGR